MIKILKGIVFVAFEYKGPFVERDKLAFNFVHFHIVAYATILKRIAHMITAVCDDIDLPFFVKVPSIESIL